MDLRMKQVVDRKRQQLQEMLAEAERLRQKAEELTVDAERSRLKLEALEEALREVEEEMAVNEAPGSLAAQKRTTEPKARRQRKRRAGKAKTSGGITIVEAIRKAVMELPSPFSTSQVRTLLQARYPEVVEGSHFASVSGTMRRMAEDQDTIKVEMKGGPGKEATYRLRSDLDQLPLTGTEV